MYLGQERWGTQPAVVKPPLKTGHHVHAVAEVGDVSGIVVSGCKDPVVGPIVRGKYTLTTVNHGRPAYKKTTLAPGGHAVMMYFYDDRDGPEASGWWLGPEIGSPHAWGFNANTAAKTAPVKGWQVPHTAPADPTFNVIGVSLANPNGVPGHRQQGQKRPYPEAPKTVPPRLGSMQAWEQQQQKVQQAAVDKADAQAAKAAEAQRKQEETNAAEAIREAIRSLGAVVEEAALPNGEEALSKAVKENLDKCGGLTAKVKKEAERSVLVARQRVARVAEAKAKTAEFQKVLVELKELTEAAEEIFASFNAEGADLEALGPQVQEKVQAGTDYIRKHQESFKAAASRSAQRPEANGKDEEAPINYGDLVKRLNECGRSVESKLSDARDAEDKAKKKADAEASINAALAAVLKYDKDKDGMLSRAEITQYAKGEYGVSISNDALGNICSRLIKDGAKGVASAEFRQLRVMVGVLREKAIDDTRKAERLAKEKALADAEEALRSKVDAATAAFEEAHKIATEAKDLAGSELIQKATKLPFEKAKLTAALEKASDLEKSIADAKRATAAAQKLLEELCDGANPEVAQRAWVASAKKKLELRGKGSAGFSDFATKALDRLRGEERKQLSIELDQFYEVVVQAVRCHRQLGKLTEEQLCKELDPSSKGHIDEASFVAFFATCKRKEDSTALPPDDGLRKVFARLDEEKAGHIAFEQILRPTREYMKVVKEIAITSALSIKDSSALRRLETNEVVEVLEGPLREEDVQADRVRARAVKDGLEGWITLQGNKGTQYMAPGGTVYKVFKETILTAAFELDAPSEDVNKVKAEEARKLRPGELVDVLEFPRKDEASGLRRLRCKARSDGKVGWATAVGNTGVVFLQMQ